MQHQVRAGLPPAAVSVTHQSTKNVAGPNRSSSSLVVCTKPSCMECRGGIVVPLQAAAVVLIELHYSAIQLNHLI